MKAIEAAEHSDVIIHHDMDVDLLFYKRKGVWFDCGGDFYDITDLDSDYIPLVPKKIYKVGDRVTFLEALNSGMCFKISDNKTVHKYQERLFFFNRYNEWVHHDHSTLNWNAKYTCTLCDDPSIPPKPTLESLPAWTRCKVKPVNYTVGICDVIKKPGGSFEYYDNGNVFGFVNVELIAVYDAKTEQWEDV